MPTATQTLAILASLGRSDRVDVLLRMDAYPPSAVHAAVSEIKVDGMLLVQGPDGLALQIGAAVPRHAVGSTLNRVLELSSRIGRE